MTDKIIIDDVDVSGCEWYKQAVTGFICADYSKSNDCSKNPNCYYKQLKRKEEELQSEKEKVKECKQALGKIKEITTLIIEDDDKPACVYDEDCPLNGGVGFDNHCNLKCPYVLTKQILQKCEVLND